MSKPKTALAASNGAPGAGSLDRIPTVGERKSLGFGLDAILLADNQPISQAPALSSQSQILNLALPNETGRRSSQDGRPQRRRNHKGSKAEVAVSRHASEIPEANPSLTEASSPLRDLVHQPTLEAKRDAIKSAKKRRRGKKQKPATKSGDVPSNSKELNHSLYDDDDDLPFSDFAVLSHRKGSLLGPFDLGIRFAQAFGELCIDIVSQQEKERPPPPNGHIAFLDFIDPTEMQFRKEYHHLRLASFDHFFVRFHLEPATSSKVQMLDDGFSMPKFFKVKCDWERTDLVPIRLFDKDGMKFVQIRFGAQWQRLSPFLDTLVRGEAPTYENMSQYWSAVQEKKLQGFPFMELPLELRQIVYRHAMFYDGTTIHPRDCDTRPWAKRTFTELPGVYKSFFHIPEKFNSALLKVSKQIRDEATDEYYRTATFNFDNESYLTIFLSMQGLGMVSRLELDMPLFDHKTYIQALVGKDKTMENIFVGSALMRLRRFTIIVSVQKWFRMNDAGLLERRIETEEEIAERRQSEEADVRQLKKDYAILLGHLENCELVMLAAEHKTLNG